LISIPPHLIFESLAYSAGFALYSRDRRRTGDTLRDPDRTSVLVAAILGAALGSKLLAWFEDPAALALHWRDWQFLLGGKTIVGGLLGGTAAVEWIKSRLGITRRTGDLFAIPLAVGIAIGRIGCYLTGLEDHTYGIASALPWAVDLGDGIRRHPVQIYEMIFLLALAALLWRRCAAPYREGAMYRLFLLAYLGFRLVIDFLKPEPKFAGLSAIQWTCAAALCWYGRDAAALLRAPESEAAHG
jgi:phosphatidylglycerol:prolipoprotein diacylglycerol transferase